MNIKERLQAFNKRWSITSDSSYGEEFQKFKIRILNILKDIDRHVSSEAQADFCQILGIPQAWSRDLMGFESSYNIIKKLAQENDENSFYRLLQVISYLPIETVYDFGNHIEYSWGIVFGRIREAIRLSEVNLAMTVVEKDGGKSEVIFHPRGDQRLDEALVEEILSFLPPNSQRHFVASLHSYQSYSPANAIKSAESLRRAIEEFLRYKLKNQRGLDKNIDTLQASLKKDNRDAAIRNIVFQTFTLLDRYFNENSKHRDGTISEAENEYMIYQSGLLLRYIDKVVK